MGQERVARVVARVARTKAKRTRIIQKGRRGRVERRTEGVGTRRRRVGRGGRRGMVGATRRARKTRRTKRETRRAIKMGGRRRRVRKVAVARAPTCCLTLFTTSSGASTWPWNRHLRSVLKKSSITEKIELHENGHERTNQLYS